MEGQAVVRSPQDLLKLVELSETIDFDNVSFDGWPVVDIKIHGGKYQGDITPEMASALYEFSQSLKRAYAAYKYGVPKVSALKGPDHELFSDLSFRVGEGCTGITAKMSETFQKMGCEIAREALQKMDSRDIARTLTVIGVFTVGALVTYKGYGLYTEAKMEQARLEAQNESQQIIADSNASLLEENRKLVKAIMLDMSDDTRHRVSRYGDQVNEGYRQVVRSVPDADHIEFGGDRLERADIDEIAAKNPITTETLPVVDEPVVIEGVTKNVSKGTISVKVSTGRFPERSITLQFIMGSLSTDADRRLYQALEHSMTKRARVTYTATINSETGEFDKGTLTHVGELESYRNPARSSDEAGLDLASD